MRKLHWNWRAAGEDRGADAAAEGSAFKAFLLRLLDWAPLSAQTREDPDGAAAEQAGLQGPVLVSFLGGEGSGFDRISTFLMNDEGELRLGDVITAPGQTFASGSRFDDLFSGGELSQVTLNPFTHNLILMGAGEWLYLEPFAEEAAGGDGPGEASLSIFADAADESLLLDLLGVGTLLTHGGGPVDLSGTTPSI